MEHIDNQKKEESLGETLKTVFWAILIAVVINPTIKYFI